MCGCWPHRIRTCCRNREGTFREDLFYRLNVVPIVVPTLRDRREDIPLLVKHFLRVHAEEQGLKIKQVSPEAMGVFMQV